MRMGDLSHRSRPSGCWSAVPGAILRARPGTRRRAAASEATSARSSAIARARDVLPAESRPDADAGRLLVPLPQIRIRPAPNKSRRSARAPHAPSEGRILLLHPVPPLADPRAAGAGREGIRAARAASCRRASRPRGRTRMHAVVPLLTTSYPNARGRTLEPFQGTTWRHKVRPGATRYDRARSGRAESPAPARQHPHPRTRRTRSRSCPRQVHKPMRILLMEVLTENDPESLPSFPAQPCAPDPPLCSQPSPR